MKHSSRLISLALGLLLALSPLAAFGAEDLNPVGELPIAKQTTKLSLLMAQDTLVEDYETNAFTKFIEESCNVDLEFVLLPAADAADKLAVMISSGEKLPDVVNFPLSVDKTYRYAQAGAFLPLNDYYKQYAVNFPKVMEMYPEFEIEKYITCPDGNLYSVPSFFKGIHDETKYKYWINMTWLKNLGMEVPTTTEELYTVLKAFKEKDPNGNNKQDEYPIAGGTGWSQDPTIFLMNSFIFDDSNDRFIVEDGKVDVAYTKDAWREGLLYMRRLVDEGLLSPISFTQDD
ncbi:MAG: extracellular solute-binding protein, partial [Clostridia bacterium]